MCVAYSLKCTILTTSTFVCIFLHFKNVFSFVKKNGQKSFTLYLTGVWHVVKWLHSCSLNISPPHCGPYAPCLSARALHCQGSAALPFPANLLHPVDIRAPCAKGLRLLRGSSAHHLQRCGCSCTVTEWRLAEHSLARLAVDTTDP